MIDDKDMELLIRRLDDRYRKIDDCSEITGDIDKREDKLEQAFAAGNAKLNVLIGILSLIAGAVVPVCINILLRR